MESRQWKGILACILLCLFASIAKGEILLDECLDQGTFCADVEPVVIADSCGEPFLRFRGRIAWPPFINEGPVILSIWTRSINTATIYPLFIEVSGHTVNTPNECLTRLGGVVLLEALGAARCGGTWETIGPVDLRQFGVALGGRYTLQATFFEELDSLTRGPSARHSVLLSCIRLESHPIVSPIEAMTWTT